MNINNQSKRTGKTKTETATQRKRRLDKEKLKRLKKRSMEDEGAKRARLDKYKEQRLRETSDQRKSRLKNNRMRHAQLRERLRSDVASFEKGMVMTFRVNELQMLLGYASQNKKGRKTQLQTRALALLKNKSLPHLMQIQAKIRELYETIQQGAAAGGDQVSPGASLISTSSQRPVQPPATAQSPVLPPAVSPSAPPSSSTPLPSQPLSNSFMSLSALQNMYGSLFGYQQDKVPQPVSGVPLAFVMHPDVRIKKLPFYEILAELVKPTSLACNITSNPTTRGQESSFMFYLTPQQASAVASVRETGPGLKCDYPVQIQLRFCAIETSCEQEDAFPSGISVKVNNKLATLPNPIPTNRPGVEPKRPPKPINISHICKLCPSEPNQVKVGWTPDYSNGYAMVIHLVKKLSTEDLLNKLKAKGIRNADYTRGLIKEKLKESDGDCEIIAVTSLRVSLLCPLGKMKMSTPARSTLCSHFQCFDASLYLQMNEKRPTWTCPVCDKQTPFNTLIIDGYFQDVLNSAELKGDQHEVQLLKDGSWSCSAAPKEKTQPTVSSPVSNTKLTKTEVIEEILDDGDDVVIAGPSVKTKPDSKGEKKMIEIDLTASDSDPEVGGTAQSNPPPSIKSHHTVSEGSNSSGGARSMESSVIMLDSPSPPESRTTSPALLSMTSTPLRTPTSSLLPHLPASLPHSYPQIIQGAGQNSSRPLVMQIRMPSTPDHGRYHPY